MKLLSLFSGIGAFEKALDRLGVKYELVGYCDIDKYASRSYAAIHGVSEDMNLGDITKVDGQALPKDIDLITYGFPCQDISLAGKQKGMFNEDGSKTRSGLFFEALRLIEDTQPKVAIAENVKNLVGKTFKPQFEIVLKSLEEAGYNNYWKVINAKDNGVPQNRERVFIVSIRKDIDTGRFTFPEGFPLELRLKDVLETDVDESYYLKKTKDFFIKNSFDMEAKGNGFRFEPHVKKNAHIAKTITTRAGGRMDDNYIIDLESESSTFKFDSTNEALIKVWDGYNQRIRADSSVVGSLTGNCGADLKRNGQGIIEAISKYDLSEKMKRYINSYDDKYKVSDGNLVINREVACTITTREGCTRADSSNYIAPEMAENTNIAGVDLAPYRIRKLTPKECFRLMDFDDVDYEACVDAGISKAQLYKQAGNSIVVACPYYIIKSLIEAGIFEYPVEETKQELVQDEVSESSEIKKDEYTINYNNLIDLLLREGIIIKK